MSTRLSSEGVLFVSTWHRATSSRPGQPKGPPKKSVPRRPAPASGRTPAPTPVPPTPPRWRWLLPAGIMVALIALLVFRPVGGGAPTQVLSYTSFVSDVTGG